MKVSVQGKTFPQVVVKASDVLKELLEKMVPFRHWVKEEDGIYNVYYEDCRIDIISHTITKEEYDQVIRLEESIEYYENK